MAKPTSVLIVDDNTSLCKAMSLVLGRKGYAVATANDGPEAIARVEGGPYDIIFMDIRMPLMDGVEAYKRIKKIRPEVVVVMMTAYADESLIREALEESAFCVIYKPLDMDRVIAIIEEAKEARKGALILVVDDNLGTCITLKNILARRGHTVGIAHTGEEALSIAEERPHDIIFIDMKLPTMNGLETHLALKEVNPEAVAIMMTAYRQEVADLVEEALSSNAYTCLYKPLDIEVLLRLVANIWERKKNAG
jgi:DNA-binding NtrC family response regulator